MVFGEKLMEALWEELVVCVEEEEEEEYGGGEDGDLDEGADYAAGHGGIGGCGGEGGG